MASKQIEKKSGSSILKKRTFFQTTIDGKSQSGSQGKVGRINNTKGSKNCTKMATDQSEKNNLNANLEEFDEFDSRYQDAYSAEPRSSSKRKVHFKGLCDRVGTKTQKKSIVYDEDGALKKDSAFINSEQVQIDTSTNKNQLDFQKEDEEGIVNSNYEELEFQNKEIEISQECNNFTTIIRDSIKYLPKPKPFDKNAGVWQFVIEVLRLIVSTIPDQVPVNGDIKGLHVGHSSIYQKLHQDHVAIYQYIYSIFMGNKYHVKDFPYLEKDNQQNEINLNHECNYVQERFRTLNNLILKKTKNPKETMVILISSFAAESSKYFQKNSWYGKRLKFFSKYSQSLKGKGYLAYVKFSQFFYKFIKTELKRNKFQYLIPVQPNQRSVSEQGKRSSQSKQEKKEQNDTELPLIKNQLEETQKELEDVKQKFETLKQMRFKGKADYENTIQRQSRKISKLSFTCYELKTQITAFVKQVQGKQDTNQSDIVSPQDI